MYTTVVISYLSSKKKKTTHTGQNWDSHLCAQSYFRLAKRLNEKEYCTDYVTAFGKWIPNTFSKWKKQNKRQFPEATVYIQFLPSKKPKPIQSDFKCLQHKQCQQQPILKHPQTNYMFYSPSHLVCRFYITQYKIQKKEPRGYKCGTSALICGSILLY